MLLLYFFLCQGDVIPVAALVMPIVVVALAGIPNMDSSSPHKQVRGSKNPIVLPGKGRVPRGIHVWNVCSIFWALMNPP